MITLKTLLVELPIDCPMCGETLHKGDIMYKDEDRDEVICCYCKEDYKATIIAEEGECSNGYMDLPKNYNLLTWQERRDVRKEYIKLQDNKCMFCNESLDKDVPERIKMKKIDWSLFPPNFLKYPVHLQHDHETGLTEGAVHSYCNAVMWQYHNK